MIDNEIEFYLVDLKSRFDKIKPNEYYLSYSGGVDSHFLYWFIKEYLKRDDIKIVGCNTYMEHQEILQRINKNSDIVLFPTKKPFDIKKQYGIPCFSKEQDFYIYYYQNSLKKGKKPSRTIQEAIDYVKTEPKSKIGSAKMEWLVGRPQTELFDKLGNRIIVKIKVRDFV